MKKILVIGDFILDKYVYCHPERINREAPTPVFINTDQLDEHRLGGTGNVVANLHALKNPLDIIRLEHHDQHENTLKSLLKDKTSQEFLIEAKKSTVVKTRFFSNHQQIFRYDHKPLNAPEVTWKLDQFKLKYSDYDYAILSDYGIGALNKDHTPIIIKKLKAKNIKVVVDPRHQDWSIYANAYLITPNFSEFEKVVGHQIVNQRKAIIEAAKKVMKTHNISNILITRSEKGMILVKEDGTSFNLHAKALEVTDVSGAGDTVVATVTRFLNVGNNLEEAVTIANRAAAIVVTKLGVVPIYLSELEELKEGHKIYHLDNTKAIAELKKRFQSNSVVLTNGAFDIIHYGHISYLNNSASLNKHLIVGLNSDQSIKKYKGKDRPINDVKKRALTLASLPFVSAVVVFEEANAVRLIKTIDPLIYTKGADYIDQDFEERKVARQVQFIEFQEGFSTSNIIKSIKKTNN